MKPQQLAALLNVTPATIRRWAREEFGEFLSPAAQGGNSLHRSFDERDVRILAWVASMRMQNLTPAQITNALRTAQADNWRDLPPSPEGIQSNEQVAMMPVDTALAKLDATKERYELQVELLTKERDELRNRLVHVEGENVELRQKLVTITEQLLELNKELTSLLKQGYRRK